MGGTGRKEEGRRIPSQSVGRTTEIGALELSQLSGEGGLSPLLSPAFVGRFHQIHGGTLLGSRERGFELQSWRRIPSFLVLPWECSQRRAEEEVGLEWGGGGGQERGEKGKNERAKKVHLIPLSPIRNDTDCWLSVQARE